MATPSNNPQDIEEWLRQKFPKMRRKFRSPSLATINGIGPRFVGRRDFDAETGSWVTNQCFCILFIPVFCMGAYRVVASGSGWQILGAEPVSSLARRLNYALLIAIAAVGSSIWWGDYTSSPKYRVEKALAAAGAARGGGDPVKAMALYESILTASELPRKEEARDGYSASFNDALDNLPLEQKQTAIKRALVARNLSPAPVQDIAERVLRFVEKAGNSDAVAAASLMKAALPAVQASESIAYRGAWRGFLEKAVAADPANEKPAIDLAVILDEEDKPEECRKLLSPHTAKLGQTEGARVFGQLLVRDGKFAEGAPLLQSYAASRLKVLSLAESKYTSAMKRVQAEAFESLNSNKASASFYRKYQAASETAKEEMVSEFVGNQMKASKEIAAALSELKAANPVVSVVLSLGIAQLNLAQASADEQARKKGLEEAEKSFLSVKSFAGQTEEYQLFLGQVSYWLGKQDEGRKLFEEFMTSHGESVEKQAMVAETLRQLGAKDESRALSEKAFATAKTDEEKFRAAQMRALTFTDTDDRITWLSRAGNSKEIQISLFEAKGEKKLLSGDKAGAEELFHKALEGYNEQPKTAASLNNSANVLSTLHGLTKKKEFFKEAINRREESLRIKNRDTVLMANLVSDWGKLLPMEAVESIEGLDWQTLPAAAPSVIASLRYKNEEADKPLREQFRTSETFRKSRAMCEQLQVLSPKDPEVYDSTRDLAAMVDDVAVLKSLRDHAANAHLEQKAAWEEGRKYWKGERDADAIKSIRAAIAEWTTALNALPKTAPLIARTACRTAILGSLVTLSRIDPAIEYKDILGEAQSIATEYPCYSTLSILMDAHLSTMLHELTAKNTELANFVKSLTHLLRSRDIVILAVERKLLPADISANPHMKAWIDGRRKLSADYPKKSTAATWALLRHIDPAAAEKERATALQSELSLLDTELDWLIAPATASNTVAMAWQEELLDHPDRAASILKDAIAHGMPLPPAK